MELAPTVARQLRAWYRARDSFLQYAPGDPGMLILVVLFVLLLPLSTPRIYATDEVQYYAYLRSLYFDGDLNFRNEYTYFARIGQSNGDPAIYNALLLEHASDPPINPATGLLRNVAPIGSAMLWSPGYLVADLLVRLTNQFGGTVAADGYSRPYIWAVCFMTAFYTLLGLLLTYRLARRVVGASIFAATLATVTVWLASPLIFYSFIAMPLSHGPAFFLVALFLTLWLWGVERPLVQQRAVRPWWRWLLLGLVGGLMTITREQLGLLMLLPALEGLVAYGRLASERAVALPQRVQAMGRLLGGHLLFLGALALALLPQLLTYQVLNGRPLPSATVSDKIESASGFSPHFFDTLIHPSHGAFLWSPVLLVGLVGLVALVRSDWLLAGLLLLGFLAQTYINGAFGSTWHLSGAFGFRRLIECTPIFVVGLTALLQWLQPRTGRLPLLLGGLFLIYWNFGLIVQWTLVRPEMRAGLLWQDMLYYQFVEVPRQVVTRLGDILVDRCSLVQNPNC